MAAYKHLRATAATLTGSLVAAREAESSLPGTDLLAPAPEPSPVSIEVVAPEPQPVPEVVAATAPEPLGAKVEPPEPRPVDPTPRIAVPAVRRMINVVLGAAMVVAIAWFFFIGFGPLSGRYRVVTVLSGSMRPHMPVGSLVVDVPEPVSALRVGQVITIKAPNGSHEVVTHRVIQIIPAAGGPEIRTKGDANAAPDAWLAQIHERTVWREVKAIPNGGRLVYFFRQPAVHRLTVDALPFLLVLGALVAIWRSGPRQRVGEPVVSA